MAAAWAKADLLRRVGGEQRLPREDWRPYPAGWRQGWLGGCNVIRVAVPPEPVCVP